MSLDLSHFFYYLLKRYQTEVAFEGTACCKFGVGKENLCSRPLEESHPSGRRFVTCCGCREKCLKGLVSSGGGSKASSAYSPDRPFGDP